MSVISSLRRSREKDKSLGEVLSFMTLLAIKALKGLIILTKLRDKSTSEPVISERKVLFVKTPRSELFLIAVKSEEESITEMVEELLGLMKLPPSPSEVELSKDKDCNAILTGVKV